MKLTVENVHKVVLDCLFKDDEPKESFKVGEGVMHKLGFHPDRLAAHEADIISMLDELPDEFKESFGGGWSFLNACMTKDGVQWGEHHDIDELIILGNAIGMVKFTLPKEMWSVLPGGMPYFSISKQLTPTI